MSVNRFKPLLATKSGEDVQDFLDADSFNKLGVADKAVLYMLEEIKDQLVLLNSQLTQVLGEDQDDAV
jgi:hypothetical protein